nr:MAG TPA: hypothetical protein [Bacteriophage sp.]
MLMQLKLEDIGTRKEHISSLELRSIIDYLRICLEIEVITLIMYGISVMTLIWRILLVHLPG